MRPLMPEVYDREKTAALLNEVRDLIAGLKTEIGEIVTQMSRLLDGDEEDTGAIEVATGCNTQQRKDGQVPPMALELEPPWKPLWRFWR